MGLRGFSTREEHLVRKIEIRDWKSKVQVSERLSCWLAAMNPDIKKRFTLLSVRLNDFAFLFFTRSGRTQNTVICVPMEEPVLLKIYERILVAISPLTKSFHCMTTIKMYICFSVEEEFSGLDCVQIKSKLWSERLRGA